MNQSNFHYLFLKVKKLFFFITSFLAVNLNIGWLKLAENRNCWMWQISNEGKDFVNSIFLFFFFVFLQQLFFFLYHYCRINCHKNSVKFTYIFVKSFIKVESHVSFFYNDACDEKYISCDVDAHNQRSHCFGIVLAT